MLHVYVRIQGFLQLNLAGQTATRQTCPRGARHAPPACQVLGPQLTRRKFILSARLAAPVARRDSPAPASAIVSMDGVTVTGVSLDR